MKKTINVFIIDDHSIVRSGIVSVLVKQGHIHVIGEASNGKEALTKLIECVPDIVIVDISLPDIIGIELLKLIKCDKPQVKVIIFTMHEEAEYIYSAIENGANGYLLKNGEIGELVKAIEQVSDGNNYFSERVSSIIVEEIKSNKVMPQPTFDTVKLSPREQEVLRLIIDGHSNKMISSTLNISVKTVAIHRTNIMKKVNAKNAADLVNKAIKNNLI